MSKIVKDQMEKDYKIVLEEFEKFIRKLNQYNIDSSFTMYTLLSLIGTGIIRNLGEPVFHLMIDDLKKLAQEIDEQLKCSDELNNLIKTASSKNPAQGKLD